MGPVLVTGAGGFIGGYVVRAVEQAGAAVIATTRDGRGGTRALDLAGGGDIGAVLAGVDTVVHCAVGNRAVTVDGTRALLAAAAGAGVRRFVHLSSVAVYGGAQGVVTEAHPTVPPGGDGYAAWKSAAEEACLAQDGIEVVRLRPTIVYGAGSTYWVGQAAERIRSGRWGVLGPAGEGTCNLVHAADVAGAVLAAATAPGVAGAVFNVNGPDAPTWNAWFSQLAAAMGVPPLRPIPQAVLQARFIASLPLKLLRRVRPGLAHNWLLGAPARSELALFRLRASFPTDAARAALGWTPTVGIEAGLADSVAWLRERGLAA